MKSRIVYIAITLTVAAILADLTVKTYYIQRDISSINRCVEDLLRMETRIVREIRNIKVGESGIIAPKP